MMMKIDNVAFALVVNSDFLKKQNKKINKNRYSSFLINELTDWRLIQNASYEERCAIVFHSGIGDQRLIDKIAETTNLHHLIRIIKRVKSYAKKQIMNH